MSPFVLAILKYAFLALVYFFVFRAIRSVALEVMGRSPRRGGKTAEVSAPARAPRGRGKPPTEVVVKREDGRKAGTHKLKEQLQVGRAEACHVRIDDRYSSQFHARLYPKNGAWYVEDLGSTNGTYLNRQRVQGPAELHAGDVIRIGKTTLELRR